MAERDPGAEDVAGRLVNERVVDLLNELDELNMITVGVALAIPMVDEKGDEALLLAGQLHSDESVESARDSSLRIFTEAVCRLLMLHEELREMVPQIMQRLMEASGGTMITVDSLEELQGGERLTSPAARAAAKRRLG